jgi:V8-like Glu-specific endopeptidase
MNKTLQSAASILLAAVWLVAGAPAPANAFEAITGDDGGGDALPSTSAQPDRGQASGAPSGDTDTRLAQAAERYKHAVGVVVTTGPKGPSPAGTAWAVAPNVFVTNAHVVQGIRKRLASKTFDTVFIALNQRADLRLRVTEGVMHDKYGTVERSFEGDLSLDLGYDVGLLRTEQSAPVTFPVASRSTLRALRPGTRVAYLGFPTENLVGGNVNLRQPVATMQSGIVTSVTDYFQKSGDPAATYLVKHNLGAAGGASGSPMFNADGEIVAILSGGNLFAGIVMDAKQGKVETNIKRVGNAAMVNFAQRADLIHDLPR